MNSFSEKYFANFAAPVNFSKANAQMEKGPMNERGRISYPCIVARYDEFIPHVLCQNFDGRKSSMVGARLPSDIVQQIVTVFHCFWNAIMDGVAGRPAGKHKQTS